MGLVKFDNSKQKVNYCIKLKLKKGLCIERRGVARVKLVKISQMKLGMLCMQIHSESYLDREEK